jgi:hypothetical protein
MVGLADIAATSDLGSLLLLAKDRQAAFDAQPLEQGAKPVNPLVDDLHVSSHVI